MKKILYIAAALAALASCNVADMDKTAPVVDGTSFVEGQKVTLTVNTPCRTKVTSEADATTGEISFKWEQGDAIKVTAGGKSATFTISNLANDGASAEFTGIMPGNGSTFDVQFPVTDPDITAQTYSATEPIPHNMMKFTASGCTVGSDLTLTPAYAALRLNFYGIDRKVSQIVVTNTSSESDPKPSYTLTINEAVKVSNSKDAPTPFFIVVPAGESAWAFRADLTLSVVSPSVDGAILIDYESESIGKGIPISNRSFGTTNSQSFAAGSILNMPAQSVTTIWAPVNCGYEPANGDYKGYIYGKLYQWGRKYGQGYYGEAHTHNSIGISCQAYEDAGYPVSEHGSQRLIRLGQVSDRLTTHPDGDSYNGSFYWNQKQWYQGGGNGAPDPDKLWGASKTEYDPCPDGWRVPTMPELNRLMGGDGTFVGYSSSGWDSTNMGYWFNGTLLPALNDGLFLPAAGQHNYDTDDSDFRGNYGYYWSSSVGSDGNVWFLAFRDSGALTMYYDCRADGCSVRCVQK